MSPPDLALLRLVAQGLVDPAPNTLAAVEWMTAMQAQDLPGALTSVALRTGSRDRTEIEAALTAGTVVRSWPMRGTLHLVSARDLGWMLELAAHRQMAAATRRREQLGLRPADIERARELAVEALHGGRDLSRAALQQAWDHAGLATTGQRGYHLIGSLAQTGTLCWGPLRGTEQHLVLLEEWVPDPRRLAREEGLREWALRYFRSHGPATVADFAWWTKLRAADVKAAVALARGGLERLDVAGTEYLLDPVTPARLVAARRRASGVLLLPGFDEFLLGYADRSAALAPEFAKQVCPGGGIFRSTVVAAGKVVGTWKRDGTGARRTVAASPFATFSASVESRIVKAYAALP